jgi:hypothetical protein
LRLKAVLATALIKRPCPLRLFLVIEQLLPQIVDLPLQTLILFREIRNLSPQLTVLPPHFRHFLLKSEDAAALLARKDLLVEGILNNLHKGVLGGLFEGHYVLNVSFFFGGIHEH